MSLRLPAWRWILLAGALLTLGQFAGTATHSAGESDDTLPRYADRPLAPAERTVYLFAVHPLHNPQRLFSKYQPLIDLVNERIQGFSLKLVASRDYQAFEQKLYNGRFHFALPNPLQTLASQRHGYRIVGKMADDDMFRGIIIMRRDSEVMFVEDLAGAALSFPAPTALAATMLPKYFLQTRGLNLAGNDLRYVGSQESAIMNVYLGKTVAAGTWPLPWDMLLHSRPELGQALEVKWRTPPLVNNGLVARRDLPVSQVQELVDVLVALPRDARGREILARINIPGFEQATAATYAPVREFLENYYRLFPAERPPVEATP
ncbi:MAG: phosphate/phosphite/phosphonate ABC transporter substrate-binding protein [Deltaproteobacteria bacterium]|nr:phosphate/phosphite/phosphonate ABC transporter substrate-binding protein [Deltaproteobacteria bacterium]